MHCSKGLWILTHLILITALGFEDYPFAHGEIEARKGELTSPDFTTSQWQSRNLDPGNCGFKYKQLKKDLNKATDKNPISGYQDHPKLKELTSIQAAGE